MDEHEKFKMKEVLRIFRKLHFFIIKITPYRLSAAIIITLILGVLPSVSVYITQYIINMVQNGEASFELLIIICLLYVFIEAVYTLLSCFQTYNSFLITKKVDLKLTEQVLGKTNELELSDFESSKVYDLINRANEQTTGKAYAFYIQGLGILQSIFLILSNIIVLLHFEEYMILLPLALLIIYHSCRMLKISEKQYKILLDRTNDARKEWYYQYLLTNDIAFKEIKLFGSHSHFLGKYKKLYQQFFEQDKKIQKGIAYTDVSMSLLEQTIVGGTFLMLMVKVYNKVIRIGDALAYVKGINNIKSGIQSLCTQVNSVLVQAYYVKLLFDFIELKKNDPYEKGSCEIREIHKIEFKNVSFRYPDKNIDTLKNINIVLKKGDTYIITGNNGSGKSTFIKLLSGYYMNYSGEIFINDINLHEIDLDTYRSRVSILLQDFVKYEMTVAENIRMSSLQKPVSDDEIKQLLIKMGLMDAVSNNLNQQLGYWFTGGTQISGGQWLKIALIRTLLRNADLNIFDEPNAVLDRESSSSVFEIINENENSNINVISLHHFEDYSLEGKKIYRFENGEMIRINNT